MILLDLFCCEGGAGEGYRRAGFDIVGVDNDPAVGRRYPGRFICADALEFAAEHGHEFDAIHASPPCEGYSIATAGNPEARAKYERLIHPTREVLMGIGKPWVIENVEQARSEMIAPVMLCGRMFRLTATDADGWPLVLERHRLFESDVAIPQPKHPRHGVGQVAGVYGGGRHAESDRGETLEELARWDRRAARFRRKGGYVPRSLDVRRKLLGIEWMTAEGMKEAIPPVYTEYIGKHLMRAATAQVQQ